LDARTRPEAEHCITGTGFAESSEFLGVSAGCRNDLKKWTRKLGNHGGVHSSAIKKANWVT